MCNVHLIKPIKAKLTKNDVEQMVKMLDEASSGNPDGWGAFTNRTKIKDGTRFVSSVDGEKLNRFVGDDFIVGHNRYTTHGKNNDRNSHPFENERLVWVHNGVLRNFDELKKKFFKDEKMIVDSEIVGAMVLKKMKDGKDIVKAIRWTASRLQGTFSIFLYDKKDNRLFYFRDSYTIKIRLIRQKVDGNFRYTIVASTKKENMKPTYKTKSISKFGFEFREFEILSSIEPKEDMVYEIDEKGLTERGTFVVQVVYEKPKVKMYSVSTTTIPAEKEEDKNKGNWKQKIFGWDREDKIKDFAYFTEEEADDFWTDEIIKKETKEESK